MICSFGGLVQSFLIIINYVFHILTQEKIVAKIFLEAF